MKKNLTPKFSTLFIGKSYFAFDELSSTNTKATELLSKSNPIEGTVISTYVQTAGRGQIGSYWESEPFKNLSFSVILYPKFQLLSKQFDMVKTISLGVADFVKEHLNGKVAIKWPNDIYVNDRKIAGILLQSASSGAFIQNMIVGIGININQVHFSENAPNPTSFALEEGKEFELSELLADVAYYVEKRYMQLRAGQAPKIAKDYMDHLFRLDKPCYFQEPDGMRFEGTIIGLSDKGKLIIENQGNRRFYDLKAIKMII